jgi:hypothetical protein
MLWSFPPQQVLTEELSADVRVAATGTRAEVAGIVAPARVRRWRLQYTVVGTSDAASMAAFYQATQGPWQSFQWINPNDACVYQVRFDSAMTLELFTPVYYRQGVDVVLVVVDSMQ